MTAMAEKRMRASGGAVRRSTHRVSVEAAARREAALARLEKAMAVAGGEATAEVPAGSSTVSQRARVQAARARYALATSTDMERVSAGAWVRRCYL